MKPFKVWGQWFLASAIGWLLSLLAMLLVNMTVIRALKAFTLLWLSNPDISAVDEVLRDNIGDGIPSRFIQPYLALSFGMNFGAIKGAAFGVVGGFAQYLVLRRHLSGMVRWIWMNAIAWACICAVLWGHVWVWGWSSTLLILVVRYGWIGAIGLGGIQWIGMQKKMPGAYGLILSSWLTWWVCINISPRLIAQLSLGALTFPHSYLWLMVGIGHGLISGACLVWLIVNKKSVNRSAFRT